MSSTPTAREAIEGSSGGEFRLMDWALIATITLIFGSAFLWISLSLRSFSPAVVAVTRVALGAVALATLKGSRVRIDRPDYKRLAAAGVFGQAVPALLFAMAEERISSALTGMLISAVPLATAIVAAIITRKLPHKTRVLGLAVGLSGVAMLGGSELLTGGGEAVGIVMVLGALVCYAIASMLYAPLQQRYGAIPVVMWSLAVATVALLPAVPFGFRASDISAVSVVAMLILGIVGTGLARSLLVTAMGRLGTVRSSTSGYFVPGVALIIGVVVLGESVRPIQVVGVSVAVLGGYLLSKAKREAVS